MKSPFKTFRAANEELPTPSNKLLAVRNPEIECNFFKRR